ncbi:MAG: hypothetical protein KA144_05085 [Xanthomonadaceae bacterium]|nr:hypothetical protein [Xanthomonadaceae bacterium]
MTIGKFTDLALDGMFVIMSGTLTIPTAQSILPTPLSPDFQAILAATASVRNASLPGGS